MNHVDATEAVADEQRAAELLRRIKRKDRKPLGAVIGAPLVEPTLHPTERITLGPGPLFPFEAK